MDVSGLIDCSENGLGCEINDGLVAKEKLVHQPAQSVGLDESLSSHLRCYFHSQYLVLCLQMT